MAIADEHLVDILEPPLYMPTGETQGIVAAIRAGAWLHTTDVWIYRTEPSLQILFQQRDLKSPTYPGKLDCSAAGYLEAGETGSTGAAREMNEELGLDIPATSLVLLGRRMNAMLDHRGRERKIIANSHIYRWNHSLNDLQLHPDEVHAVFWIGAEDLALIEKGGSISIDGINAAGESIQKQVIKEDFAYNIDDYYFTIAERIRHHEDRSM